MNILKKFKAWRDRRFREKIREPKNKSKGGCNQSFYSDSHISMKSMDYKESEG